MCITNRRQVMEDVALVGCWMAITRLRQGGAGRKVVSRKVVLARRVEGRCQDCLGSPSRINASHLPFSNVSNDIRPPYVQ